MSNRYCNPDDQYCDNTGTPYAGGSLSFFASGTSTPLNTYSDSALTIPNANPITLDSAGRAGSIFLSNLAYKAVLKDVNSNIIWTMDPVSTSDFTGVAQFQTNVGSPNGSVAGTAGSGSTPSSAIWDRTNNILYVCTTTGSSSTAVWTAVNATTTTSALPRPGGYLTTVSATPIITSDSTNVTSLFYTPYQTNQVPIYNGSAFTISNFVEQTLTLDSTGHVQNSIYDVFAFLNSGTFTIGTGPAWGNILAGTGARGSGANTTQLQLISGLWVNAVSIVLRNNSVTYNVSANQATYLGSLYISGTSNGHLTCQRTYGQSRVWGIWNAYNRTPLYLKAGDPNATWTFSGAASFAARPANNNTANSMTIFVGLLEEVFTLALTQSGQNNATGASEIRTGIGFNSTTTYSGKRGDNANGSTAGNRIDMVSRYITIPGIGINVITALEQVVNQPAGTGQTTFFGTESDQLLEALWRG